MVTAKNQSDCTWSKGKTETNKSNESKRETVTKSKRRSGRIEKKHGLPSRES